PRIVSSTGIAGRSATPCSGTTVAPCTARPPSTWSVTGASCIARRSRAAFRSEGRPVVWSFVAGSAKQGRANPTRIPRMSQTRGKPLDYGILPSLLAYRLRQAKARFSQHFAKTVGQDGITLGQFDVLTLIARNPGLTQTTLARAVGIERSTMVVVIDRL